MTFLKITTQNSEIIQLKQKLKELEKKISEKNNDFFQKIKKEEEELALPVEENTIDYLELHNKFDFNDNLKDKMPIVQNCWVSETTLAEKIKIINKQSKKDEEGGKKEEKKYVIDLVKTKNLQKILDKTKYVINSAFVEEKTTNVYYVLDGVKKKQKI